MAYIRDRKEERTGFQEASDYTGRIDLGADFVMVYGLNGSTAERIKAFKDAGYVIHLMTGIAWGDYFDYLYGRWDGRRRLDDESQIEKNGDFILHGSAANNETLVPYMVPTVAFADYLTEKLKKAVDQGVEAIHVEEPEFWEHGGYSPAFKREYLLYYREEWQPPDSSVDAHYKCARLKAYLYRRTIDRVSAALKAYAMEKYGRVLRFYVPTHSLLNYTQWRIISPEASLTDVPGVDGYIAQIWTGTSRQINAFEGKIAERTFETAYLEYGVMQELVSGTGREMWFLADPIEDATGYDWNDYRKNYFKTLTASLMHPGINRYEICPWPDRVFGRDRVYPRRGPDPKEIPWDYRAVLCGCFQMLGDMPAKPAEEGSLTGILISDTALYQRSYPGVPAADVGRFVTELFTGNGTEELKHAFEQSVMLPGFYGLALPLLKSGLPLRPVCIDNARRYTGYLDPYRVIVASYEFFKPEYPELNGALAEWVKAGGVLVYVGDGSDPYHRINGFWAGKYNDPAEHLFSLLGVTLPSGGEKSITRVGKGVAALWNASPTSLCYSAENAEQWRNFFAAALAKKHISFKRKNSLVERRGPYVIAAVLDETGIDRPVILKGLYADMYTPDFKVKTRPRLDVGENGVFFDISAIDGEDLRIIGTSARVMSLLKSGDSVTLTVRAAACVKAAIRLRTPWTVSGKNCKIKKNTASRTVLLEFDGDAKDRTIVLSKSGSWQRGGK